MKIRKVVIIGGIKTALNITEQIIDAGNNFDQPLETAGIIIETSEKGTLNSGFPVLGGLKDIPELLKNEELLFIYALYKPEKLRERYNLLKVLTFR